MGQPQPKRPQHDRIVPMINVVLNSRLGTPQPIVVKALLDSGGSECMIRKDIAKKLRIKKTTAKTWTTAAGNFATEGTTKAQFQFPELRSQSIIEWDMHVTDADMHYDMIIGRDLLSELGIILDFNMNTIE